MEGNKGYTMRQLNVKEFKVKESSEVLSVGATYSYFEDPDTGKYYRPTEALMLSLDTNDFKEWFVEVTN